MRPRGSIIGQLLVAFCVCAVLIGIGAVAGFVTVTDQNAATAQVTDRYTALQRVNSQLETAFGTATFAVLFYADTGQHGFLARLNANISGLGAVSRDRLERRLAWSGAALAVAVLLVLAASLSTVYTITRPMRRVTATVRRLTAGDYSARAPVAGSAEVRQVAESINTQDDEAGRLRAAEAESNRLRAMAREAGLRIREHLVARDVLHAAKLAVEQIVAADVAYLRLVEDDQVGSVVGHAPRWLIPADVIRAQLTPGAMDHLRALFRTQTSMVINDMSSSEDT